MDVEKYLERICFEGGRASAKVDFTTLRKIQNGQQLTVPFENLDAMADNHRPLKLETIYSKIVNECRGGWCFEQNALLWWALKEIGFDVDIIGSDVARSDGTFGPSNAHLLVLVRLHGKRFIADAGFGSNKEAFDPVEIAENVINEQANGRFKLVNDAEGFFRLVHQKVDCADKEDWTMALYRFKTTPTYQVADFAEAHREFSDRRESTSILTESAFALLKVNKGLEIKLYMTNFYRHYGNISLKDKVYLEKRNQLSRQDTQKMLLDEFGLTVDMSLVHRIRNEELEENQEEKCNSLQDIGNDPKDEWMF